MLEVPYDFVASVSTDPLTVDVDIDVHIDITSHIDIYVCCRDRLSQGGRRSNRGEEGQRNFEWLRRFVRDGVAEVSSGGIVLRAKIRRIGDIVSIALLA